MTRHASNSIVSATKIRGREGRRRVKLGGDGVTTLNEEEICAIADKKSAYSKSVFCHGLC